MIKVETDCTFASCRKYFVLTSLNFCSASHKNKLLLALLGSSVTIVDQANGLGQVKLIFSLAGLFENEDADAGFSFYFL